jgi:hypothetical protein
LAGEATLCIDMAIAPGDLRKSQILSTVPAALSRL